MRRTRYAIVALAGALLLLSACKQDHVAKKDPPATFEDTDREGIKLVRLKEEAAKRIGLQTATVTEENVRGVSRKVVPYGAIMYDTHGNTWTYTSPEPMAFVREPIAVERVDGDRVILTDGPPVGTVVVVVGATELSGVEHNY